MHEYRLGLWPRHKTGIFLILYLKRTFFFFIHCIQLCMRDRGSLPHPHLDIFRTDPVQYFAVRFKNVSFNYHKLCQVIVLL